MPSYDSSSSDFFFNLTTLFSYQIVFSLFHAPLDVVVHFLVFLRSFRLKSLLFQFSSLSHRSRISAVIQGFFFCLPRISLAVSVTAVLKVMIIESMSVSSLLMMVRGANLPPIIAWRVSNMLGFFSFSRSNLSLVRFGLLIFFRRRRKVIISKPWSLPMSAPGKLSVLAMFTPGSLQKFSICATKGENWERKDSSLKDLRNIRQWTTSRGAWKRLKKTG